jgi:hypothetical protein
MLILLTGIASHIVVCIDAFDNKFVCADAGFLAAMVPTGLRAKKNCPSGQFG